MDWRALFGVPTGRAVAYTGELAIEQRLVIPHEGADAGGAPGAAASSLVGVSRPQTAHFLIASRWT